MRCAVETLMCESAEPYLPSRCRDVLQPACSLPATCCDSQRMRCPLCVSALHTQRRLVCLQAHCHHIPVAWRWRSRVERAVTGMLSWPYTCIAPACWVGCLAATTLRRLERGHRGGMQCARLLLRAAAQHGRQPRSAAVGTGLLPAEQRRQRVQPGWRVFAVRCGCPPGRSAR